MMLTIEDKLDKAIEFIKSIEKLDCSKYNRFKLGDLEKDARGECIDSCMVDDYCTDLEVQLHWPSGMSNATKVIDEQVLDDLSDKAWHLLAGLT